MVLLMLTWTMMATWTWLLIISINRLLYSSIIQKQNNSPIHYTIICQLNLRETALTGMPLALNFILPPTTRCSFLNKILSEVMLLLWTRGFLQDWVEQIWLI